MKEPLLDDVLENEDIENLLEAEITDNPESILRLIFLTIQKLFLNCTDIVLY